MPKSTPEERKSKPKMVNRGPAGLLQKIKKDGPEEVAPVPEGKRNRIAPALKRLAVDLTSLVPDPDNARLHPDKNLDAIKASLSLYGQVKPLVVRRRGMVVVAGNGTLRAAREMGWTRLAAAVVDMTDVEAAGYGLADNRTAELAAWDFEVVARLEKLMAEAGQSAIGWSQDELAALRNRGWVEPPSAFPEVDESIETEHVCPKCGYAFSGGEVREKGVTDEEEA